MPDGAESYAKSIAAFHAQRREGPERAPLYRCRTTSKWQLTALNPGDDERARAFDDANDHLFRLEEMFEDCVTGPLADEYAEPIIEMIPRVISATEPISKIQN